MPLASHKQWHHQHPERQQCGVERQQCTCATCHKQRGACSGPDPEPGGGSRAFDHDLPAEQHLAGATGVVSVAALSAGWGLAGCPAVSDRWQRVPGCAVRWQP